MSTVLRQVSRTRSRLTTNLFMRRLALCLVIAAIAWGLATLVVRLALLGLPLFMLGGAAIGLGVLAALIATLVTRPSALKSAVALDQAAGLKERLSTALVVHGRNDEFAQAAIRDAERLAARLHVPSHVRLRAPGLWPWSAASLMAAVLLAAFLPPIKLWADKPKEEAPKLRSMALEEHANIKAELEEAAKRLSELKQGDQDFKDVADKLEDLKLPEGPQITPEDVRREAVRKIDEAQDAIKEQLEKSEASRAADLKRLLSELEKTPQPRDKKPDPLSDALAQGDFNDAKQQLEKLAQEVKQAAANAQDPEQQKKLEDLQKQLKDLSDQVSKLDDQKRMQKELERKAGLSEEQAKQLMERLANMDPNQLAQELQKQLDGKGLSEQQLKDLADKMKRSQEAQKMAKDLAQKLAQAAESAGKCQNPGDAQSEADNAAQSLGQAGQMLSDQEAAQEMLKEMRAERDRLQDLRDNLGQGPGRNQNEDDRIGDQGPEYGRGQGATVGRNKTPHQTTPEKANTKPKGGEVIGRMLIDGPQFRGQVSAEEVAAAQAEVRAALDAVERENVPRQYQHVVQEYFERLAGLARARQSGTTSQPAP